MNDTFVQKLEPLVMVAFEKAVRGGRFEFRPVDHAVFSARGEGVVCTLYNSGKLVVQGPGTAQFVEHYLGVQPEEKIDERTAAMLEFPVLTIGSDETGKGDYFGPLVVAAAAFEPADVAKFTDIRLDDSKKLTAASIKKAAAEIRECLPHKIVMVNPPKYNELYRSFGNLNRLLAWCHATAIEGLLETVDAKVIIVDKFCDESLLRREMKEKTRARKLHMVTKAERYPAVAAASILASDAFHRAMGRLTQECGVTIPKGAGAIVDRTAKQLVQAHGPAILEKVAKLHFKTTEKILGPGSE